MPCAQQVDDEEIWKCLSFLFRVGFGVGQTRKKVRTRQQFEHAGSSNVLKGRDQGKWTICGESTTNMMQHKKKLCMKSESLIKTNTDKILNNIAFSPNGQTLAWDSENWTLVICNIETKSMKSLKGHTDWVKCVVFSQDSKLLASCSNDHTVRLWDVRTGKSLKVFRGHADWVQGVAFSPNGTTLASSSIDEPVRLWDVASGELIRVLKGNGGWSCSILFSPDGQTVASGDIQDKTVRLWNVGTGEQTHVLATHDAFVFFVAFLSNNKIIASCFHALRIWNAQTGMLMRVLDGPRYSIYCLNFLSNEQMLSAHNGYDFLTIWNLKTGHTKSISSCKPPKKFKKITLLLDNKALARSTHNGEIEVLQFWKPLQQILQKYTVLLSKSSHLSSTSILIIFQAILNQKNVFTIVSDSDILQFIDFLKRLQTSPYK